MRFFLLLGRGCAQVRVTTPCPRLSNTGQRFSSSPLLLRPQPRSRQWHHHHHQAPRSSRLTLKAASGAAALGTAAFVKLSEEDNRGTVETAETRMLEASRAEIAAKKPDADQRGLERLKHGVGYYLDVYVWEPIATGLRFLQLAVIFIPVVVTVPALWIGARVPERDNERSGALWWFGYLVQSMEWAGPAFIKLGQWAASRTDIFPTEMCDIMSKLHSNAPAHSMHDTRRIVEAAFDGRDFADIFAEFDEKPLGVGAIAQVYKAKLKPDLAAPGDVDILETAQDLRRNVRRNVDTVLKSSPRRVPSSYIAVKVLHPGVDRVVQRDLRIMGFFASLLNVIPTIEWLSLPDEVAVFGEMMKLQLDLRIEATNLTVFRRNFKDRTTAWFPFPYTEFTTRNVLVEEFAQGIPLADFIEHGGGVFQKDIAGEGLDAFLRMLLLDNFVHADLHPGNIMVRFYQAYQPNISDLRDLSGFVGGGRRRGWHDKNGKPHPEDQADVTEQVLSRLRPFREGTTPENRRAWEAELAKIDAEGYRPQLIFIDTGLVTSLNEVNRRNFLDLFLAVAEFDGYRAGHLMCERCRQPSAVVDREVFALRMQHLVLAVKSRTLALGNVKIGDVLQQVLGLVRAHHVRLEGDFVNVVISILLLEGIGRSLYPDLDLLNAAVPILRQLSAQSGAEMVKAGDFSMIMVLVGLEARRFLQASIEDVENCVKYDLLSPNV